MTKPLARKLHYRVFFRNNTNTVVFGRAELAAALARKSPAAIHHEIALMHTCTHCGHRGPWSKEWMAYPIWNRIRAYHSQTVAEVIYCSHKCWIDATGGFDLPTWMNLNHEPNRDRARQRALWDANSRERDRKADLVAHRRVPLPEWPGEGFCRWCAGKITDPRRKSWHEECLRPYWLHSALNTQMHFLKQRDGERCAIEGCDGEGRSFHGAFEVDHRVPLWLVAHLPDDVRRWFYGPENLWLLCGRHHAEKTRFEAGLRAAIRRGEVPLPMTVPIAPPWPPQVD